MAGKQDVLDMLEHVGAERIPCGSVHMKFRLPNKKMFVAPSTPSDHLSWDNSLAQLRRELRMTHPEIANWRKNYTPPKNKRSYTELAKTPGISLGELLTPFFKCASIAMNALNKMLPDGAEMTLIVRFPKIDNSPLIVSSDDLNEVQKALARVNDPATQGDYHVTYTNPAMQGRPN